MEMKKYEFDKQLHLMESIAFGRAQLNPIAMTIWPSFVFILRSTHGFIHQIYIRHTYMHIWTVNAKAA